MEANIECRSIVTRDFTQNEVMKYFDYEIHKELKNSKYLHEKGLFVGNRQVLIKDEIRYLHKILS
jgi:CDP-6-deoxy-D-xylo-4-hexulose-3-dehydrase